MIEERAEVTEILDQAIQVESLIKSTCDQCQQVDNCANGQVAKALPHKKMTLVIPTEDEFAVGDNVYIAIPEKYLLASAWHVYMLPLIGLIFFAGIGQYMYNQHILANELIVVVIAIFGGVLGWRLAKWWQVFSGLNQKLVPKIIKKIPPELIATPVK